MFIFILHIPLFLGFQFPMFLRSFLCFFVVGVVLAQTPAPQCNRSLAERCTDQLANRLGFPSVPHDTDLPKDFNDFIVVVQDMISQRGSSGLETLCGHAFEFFTCLGPQVAACSEVSFSTQHFGLTTVNAIAYRAYQSQVSQECSAILLGIERFNCVDRDLAALHLSPQSPCGNSFYICSSVGLPFKGLCADGETLDTSTRTCRPVTSVSRCGGVTVPETPMDLRQFTCPRRYGRFANPEMECSMVYYQCSRGQARVQVCPRETYYDDVTKDCSSMDRVPSCAAFIVPPPATPPRYGSPATSPPVTPSPPLAPPMITDCRVGENQANRCIVTFARAVGLRTLPNDSFSFLRHVDNILLEQGRTGLASICSAVTDLLTCIPQVGLRCFSIENIQQLYGLSVADANAYIQFFQRFGFECQAVYGERQPFSCMNKRDGIYVPSNRPCSTRFLICFDSTLMFGRCPVGTTIEPSGNRCLSTSQIDRCVGRPVLPEITPEANMPTLTCPSGYGSSRNPVMSCSMLYVNCQNGRPSITRCHGSTVFDDTTSTCRDISLVRDCNGRGYPSHPVPQNPTPGYSGTPPPFQPPVTFAPQTYAPRTYATPSQPPATYAPRTYAPPSQPPVTIPPTRAPRTYAPPASPPRTYAPQRTVQESPRSECQHKGDGNIADPSNTCSPIYYSCVGGSTFERECQSGTFYDPVEDACDFQQHVVVCGGRPRPPTEAPRPRDPVNFDCNGKHSISGNFLNPDSQCSYQYYSCVGVEASARICATRSLRFSAELNYCDSPEFVPECGGSPRVPFQDEPQPQPVPVDFDCNGQADGYYSSPQISIGYAHGQCSAIYYSCTGGIARRHSCDATTGSGLVFDQELEACNPRGEIPLCGGIRPPPRDDPVFPAKIYFTHPGFACVSPGNVGDPRTPCSTHYVACNHQLNAELMPCGGTLYYDPSDDQCKASGNISVCGKPQKDQQSCGYDGLISLGRCQQGYQICKDHVLTVARCSYGQSFQDGQCRLNSLIGC